MTIALGFMAGVLLVVLLLEVHRRGEHNAAVDRLNDVIRRSEERTWRL